MAPAGSGVIPKENMMLGVTLSRWTMSYFFAALSALVAAEIMMVAGFGYPTAGLRAPETLILVHVTTIGWLSLLMCGALFQFAPVLIARRLYSDTLPLPALLLVLAGLGLLLVGFLQLTGRLSALPSMLPLAGIILSAGFAVVLWNLGRTLWPARPLPLPARFVATGLVSLALTVAFGVVFVTVLGQQTNSEPMLAIAGAALPLHIAAGIGGWLTVTAVGVSYRLLAMFMLAPELGGARPKLVLVFAIAALVAVVAVGLGAVLTGASLLIPLVAGSILALVSLVLYGADIIHLYRARKRRFIELNSRMAIFALASLAAAVVLAIALTALGRFNDGVGAVVFLLAFGWLSGLGLAKLYKIVAFLTWLECYGPVLGRMTTPRVQDLVVESRARKWFLLYFLAVWLGTLALLISQPIAFRVAVAAMLAATIGVVSEFVQTRLLSDVKTRSSEPDAPDAVHRPHLLFSRSPSN
jgi:hypothetical protein